MEPLSIRSLRGDTVETQHQVHIAVVDATGALLFSQGDIDSPTPVRSAAKPFQAVPLLSGPDERWGLTEQDIALACASHNSERRQVEMVGAFLERIGLDQSALACGPHRPLAKELGYPLAALGERPELASPSSLASNCSGKHTGMLAVALHHDWPIEGYHRFGHPVQEACRDAVADYCGMSESEIAHSVDGCGAVCWALPLVALARGFSALAARSDSPTRRIVRSMVEHPELIAGWARLCTALMSAYPHSVLAKVGAGGVYGAAALESGIGIGIKVADGNTMAAGVALLAVLEQLDPFADVTDRLAPYVQPPVMNTRREVVGRMEVVGRAVWNRASAR
jgi:L-asparaginase II